MIPGTSVCEQSALHWRHWSKQSPGSLASVLCSIRHQLHLLDHRHPHQHLLSPTSCALHGSSQQGVFIMSMNISDTIDLRDQPTTRLDNGEGDLSARLWDEIKSTSASGKNQERSNDGTNIAFLDFSNDIYKSVRDDVGSLGPVEKPGGDPIERPFDPIVKPGVDPIERPFDPTVKPGGGPIEPPF